MEEIAARFIPMGKIEGTGGIDAETKGEFLEEDVSGHERGWAGAPVDSSCFLGEGGEWVGSGKWVCTVGT